MKMLFTRASPIGGARKSPYIFTTKATWALAFLLQEEVKRKTKDRSLIAGSNNISETSRSLY